MTLKSFIIYGKALLKQGKIDLDDRSSDKVLVCAMSDLNLLEADFDLYFANEDEILEGIFKEIEG